MWRGEFLKFLMMGKGENWSFGEIVCFMVVIVVKEEEIGLIEEIIFLGGN